MHLRNVLTIMALFFCSLQVNGQSFPQDNWYLGNVTLSNGEKKEGTIKYDLETNTIQLQWNNKIETYHASQFITFSIYLESEELYRNFYVLPHANAAGYKRPTIFELIMEGEISLVAREYIGTRNDSVNNGFIGSRWGAFNNPFPTTFTTQYLAFRLFLVDRKGNVTGLSNNKKDVIAAFGDHQKELKRYMKEEKIKVDQVADVAQLVNYFNQLNSF